MPHRFNIKIRLTMLCLSGLKYTLVGCEQQWNRTGTSRSHMSNMVPERLTERVWWTKSQSSLLNIYYFLSWSQSSFLLTSVRVRYLLTMNQNLTDMWRSISQMGKAQVKLRWRNRFVNGFRAGARAILTKWYTCILNMQHWMRFIDFFVYSEECVTT